MSIFGSLRDYWKNRKLREAQDSMEQVSLITGTRTPVSQTEGGRLFRMMANNECPSCHRSLGFYRGPSGGMSTNYYCQNPECAEGYNVTEDIGIAEKIGNGKDKFPEWWEPKST